MNNKSRSVQSVVCSCYVSYCMFNALTCDSFLYLRVKQVVHCYHSSPAVTMCTMFNGLRLIQHCLLVLMEKVDLTFGILTMTLRYARTHGTLEYAFVNVLFLLRFPFSRSSWIEHSTKFDGHQLVRCWLVETLREEFIFMRPER